MIKKGVKLYKLKYISNENKNDTQWSVGILAMGWEDAEGYLRSKMGDIRIEERGGTFDVDTITPESLIPADPVVVERIVTKDSEDVSEDAPEPPTTEDGRVVCPWCGKSYKSLTTLETHIRKSHLE